MGCKRFYFHTYKHDTFGFGLDIQLYSFIVVTVKIGFWEVRLGAIIWSQKFDCNDE